MLLITLLGEQGIVDGSTGEVRTRSLRTVALVGYLAVHAHVPQPRQRMAGLFWPDSSEGQALTNLRRELHQLRQILGGCASLVVTSTDLCWRDDDACRIDVREFERERALALASGARDTDVVRHGQSAVAAYGGDLLPALYDDWVLDERDRLQQACVELCDLVSLTARRVGQLAVAVDLARRRVRVQPLEEGGYRALMELQAEQGDRAGAVSTFHHCSSVLELELGLEPDQATTRLRDRLVGSTGGPEREVPATASQASSRSGLGRTGLLGREGELAALRSPWQSAAQGHPQVVVVEGDPGVGKTRLVTELAADVRRAGAVAATSQCFETSGSLALAPVADWLRDPSVRSATQRLSPVWRSEVDRLVPAEGQQPGLEPPPATTMVDAWQRRRFFEGLARALLAVPEPTLLVLDNAHWCDEETLAFLDFLLHLSQGEPLMLAATVRSGHQNRKAAQWQSQLRSSGLLTQLRLDPLGSDETAQLAGLLSDRSLSPDEARLLHAATGGFPLYVVEAARASIDLADRRTTDAGELNGVLRKRIEETTPDAQEVAGLAAALGRDFTLPLLTEASQLDAESVVRAVDELWRRRILRELEDGYDFAHDLLRDAAFAAVSPPHRWALHRQLARGLELINRGHTDAVAAQLAEQYRLAGDHERAIYCYHRAAEMSAAVFGHVDAIKQHRRRLELLHKVPAGRNRDVLELETLLAMAPSITAVRGYATPDLQQAFERMQRAAERLGRTDAVRTGLVGLWTCSFVQGRTRQAYDTGRRLLELQGSDNEQYGQAEFALAGSALHLGKPREAAEHFDVALGAVGESVLAYGTRARVHARAWSAHAMWILGEPDSAAERCDTALDEARAREQPYTLAVALAFAGVTHQLLGEDELVEERTDELRRLCARYGFAYYPSWGAVLHGWSTGGAEGISLIRRGIENLQRQGAFARMSYWLYLLADATSRSPETMGQSGVETVRTTLDAALVEADTRDDLWWKPELIRYRAALEPPDVAVAHLADAVEQARRQQSITLQRRCERDLVAVRERGGSVRPITGDDER